MKPVAVLLITLIPLLPENGVAAEVPFLGGRVNDLAEILSAETHAALESSLAEHERLTSNQVVVLTITSLEGEVLEEFSHRVASTWGLGTAEKDNGVLLLVAKNERKLRIEVGDGLEGVLPDIACGSIIRNEIVPRFKSGDYDGGVTGGIEAILLAIQGEYSVNEVSAHNAHEEWIVILLGSVIFFFVVGMFTMVAVFTKGVQSWFLFVFLMPFWIAFPSAFYGVPVGVTMFVSYVVLFLLSKRFLRSTSRGRAIMSGFGSKFVSSGGSSSGGGGFSGGGGSFSGGGASGSW